MGKVGISQWEMIMKQIKYLAQVNKYLIISNEREKFPSGNNIGSLIMNASLSAEHVN